MTMMTAVMMKVNITYHEALDMEYHTLKKFMDSIVEVYSSLSNK